MTPELTRVLWCTMFFRLFQALLSCWKDGTDYSSKAKLPTDAILMRTERMVRVNRCMWHHVACNLEESIPYLAEGVRREYSRYSSERMGLVSEALAD